MIGKIRGILLEKQPPQILVEVNGGIGYEIDVPMSTIYQLPEVGQVVALLTHFVVREDAQHLYGFLTTHERHLFRALLKVNGIGPRSALSILSSVQPAEFVRYVLNNETAHLVRLPGIGKKTAERLVIEMRDTLSHWYDTTAQSTLQLDSTMRHQTLQDAISALIALGYKQAEANRAVTKIDDGVIPSEELIRRALREGVS